MEGSIIPSEIPRCSECHSQLIRDVETGEWICPKCGKVAEKEMATGPEWRDFGDEESKKRDRVGAPITILIPDKGFPTVIRGSKSDARGRDLSPSVSEQMTRLAKIQQQAKNYPERSLYLAINILRRASNNLSLAEGAVEMAAKGLEEAITAGLAKGRKMEAVVGACIYEAGKISGNFRECKKIAQELGITKKEIQKTDRLIRGTLNKQVPLLSPEFLMPQFGERLEIFPTIVTLGIKIIRKIASEQSGRIMLSGKDPRSWAASGLYMACLISGNSRTQKEIADVIEITEVTLRNRCKDLARKIDITIEI